MVEEIKNWFTNIEKNDDFEIEYSENNTVLKKYYIKNKNTHVYHVTSKLSKLPSFYFDYVWDDKKILSLNENIIKEINIINKNQTSQQVHTVFSFQTRNVSLDPIDRNDQIYLEKHNDNSYTIYGKTLPSTTNDNNYTHIENGYSYLNISRNNGKTTLEFIAQFDVQIPAMLEKIPGILLLKSILNLKKL